MKILKNLFLFVFAAAIFAGCQKSNVTPGNKCGHDNIQSQDQPSTSSDDNTQSKGRSAILNDNDIPDTDEPGENNLLTEPTEDPQPYGVSGSGDDDRDGGDRRKKR